MVIDSGNLLFKPGLSGEKVSAAAHTKATIIAETFIAGLNAVTAIGRNDLAAGPLFLKKLEEEYSFQFLSANLVASDTDTPIFQPFTTKMIGDLHIGIIGLTGSPLPSLPREPVSLLPWETVLPKLIKQLSSKVDMLILLSNLPPQESRKIAQEFDAVNLIFQSGNTTKGNNSPYTIRNTLICQTATRGKYQGVIEVKWNESRKWQTHAKTATKLYRIENQLEQVAQKIQQSEEEQSDKNRKNTRLIGLQKLKQKLVGQQKHLQQQLNENKKDQRATYNNRFIGLSPRLADDPQTVKRIREIRLR